MGLLTEHHRKLIGKVQLPVKVIINRSDIIKYSIATEQLQKKYLKGDEAPLMFIFNLFNPISPIDALGRDGLDKLGSSELNLPLKRVMSGGAKIKPQ